MKKKKIKRKLTYKQKAFIRKTLQTHNPIDAALEVYNVKNRHVARAIATENLAKPAIKEAMDLILKQQGVDDTQLLLDTYHFVKKSKESKVTASDGLRALELLFKLKGYLNNKPVSETKSLTIQYNNLSKQELLKERSKLKSFWSKILDK